MENVNKLKLLIIHSSIYGLSKIFSSNHLVFRLLWSILLLVSTILAAYFSTNSIFNYLSFGKFSLIETINEFESEFPTVSFCHRNNSNFSFTVIDMWYNLKKYKLDWMYHMETFEDLQYGKCYRFNSGKDMFNTIIPIKKSTLTGPSNGLILELYVPSINTNYGEFQILIHNKSIKLPSLFNHGHYITSGTIHFFSIKRTFEKKLELPYNDCYTDIDQFPKNKSIIEYFQKLNYAYSQKECIRLCQNLEYSKLPNLNCTLNSLADDLYLRCYKKRDAKSKEANVTLLFLESFQQQNPYQTCSIYCPLECESFNLDMVHEFNQIVAFNNNSINIAKSFRTFQSLENITKSYLQINVFYDDLKYNLIAQQEKVLLFDLVSNIGGIFGLFIGINMLSFIELFEIFFKALYIIAHKKV